MTRTATSSWQRRSIRRDDRLNSGHHRRIVRRPAPAVLAIASQEGAQIHRVDGVEHEPREVVLRQPLAQARRQQQLLLAITRDEVLPHPQMVLTPPDGALCNSLDEKLEPRPLRTATPLRQKERYRRTAERL